MKFAGILASFLLLPAHAAWADDDDLRDVPYEVAAEVRCGRDGDANDPVKRAKLNEKVPDHYALWVRGGLSGSIGASTDTVGFGIGAAAEGTLGWLHPLTLNAGVRWLPTAGQFTMFDATAGFSFRSYGTEWIKAGGAVVGNSVQTWNSNCQVRRTDWTLLAGGKLIHINDVPHASAPGIFALQAGIQHLQARDARSPISQWTLAALYDPQNAAFGAQFSLGAQGIIIAMPGPDWFYTGVTTGLLVSSNYTTMPWWFTLDLGVGFPL
jgi:hypothetical protein